MLGLLSCLFLMKREHRPVEELTVDLVSNLFFHSSFMSGEEHLTSIPTLPPRRNTLPGSFSPELFETSAFNFTNPSLPPPNRSTDWISILRRIYGSPWNSCEGFSCCARERWRVEIQILNAGKDRRSSRVRSGVLLMLRLVSGIVNVDMVAFLGSSAFGWRWVAGFRCRAVRRSLGSMNFVLGGFCCW